MTQSNMIIKHQKRLILSNNYIKENYIIYNEFNIIIELTISE